MNGLHLRLLSNSRDPDGRFLEWARPELAQFLGGVATVTFVPYAGVTIGWDAYAARLREAFAAFNVGVSSVHEVPDAASAIASAEAIVVGGGNTFRLLEQLYETGLLEPIRARVRAGAPYVGWSAGSVVACPTIQTTNDMAIVMPPRFEALDLVPFQINAHYTDVHPPGFQGETRAERLAEYIALNRQVAVIGLPEGSLLRVDDGRVELAGAGAAPLFRHGASPSRLESGCDLAAVLAPGAA